MTTAKYSGRITHDGDKYTAAVTCSCGIRIERTWDSYDLAHSYMTAGIERARRCRIAEDTDTMKPWTYRYEQVPANELRSTDLRHETSTIAHNYAAYRITVYDETGTVADPEPAEAVHIPAFARLGITWGGPAVWADVPDLDTGIDWWLNDGDEWDSHS